DNRQLGEDWLSFSKAVASQVVQALELARTLAQLRASEQRYRDLVEGLDAIIWEADAQTGQYTFVSPRAENLLGYPVSCWLAYPGFRESIVHAEDLERTREIWKAARTEGQDQVLEYRATTVDGRVLWLHETVRVLRDAGGLPRQVRGVIVDI